MAAEYIASAGNPNIIMCERGIRTFETYARNTLDLTAVPVLHHLTHLPVVVDPSHATGKRWLVKPLAIGGVAVGADGIMVEVHPRPDEALSDGEQSLTFAMFDQMMTALTAVHEPRQGPARRPRSRTAARRRRGRVTRAMARPDAARGRRDRRRRSSCARPRACAGRPRLPGRQVDLASGAPARAPRRGREPDRGRRRRRGRAVDGRASSPPSGATVERVAERDGRVDYRVVSPGGDALAEPEDILDCGNSGTTRPPRRRASSRGASLFASSTATPRSGGGRWAGSWSRCALMGATFAGRGGAHAACRSRSPGRVRLTPITYDTPVPSAQVKSAILLAGARGRRRDVGHRGRRDPRPHRADAARPRRGRATRAPRPTARHTVRVAGPSTVAADRRDRARRPVGAPRSGWSPRRSTPTPSCASTG